MDDFDFPFPPSIDKRQIDELATMRFLENGENVVFLGPPGVGKTHLASPLGLVAAQHRFSTYYINYHQLIAMRYEKTSTVFTSNKTFSQWNEVFADVLDRVLHHCTVINIKGGSCRLSRPSRSPHSRWRSIVCQIIFQHSVIQKCHNRCSGYYLLKQKTFHL